MFMKLTEGIFIFNSYITTQHQDTQLIKTIKKIFKSWVMILGEKLKF